MKLSPLLFLSPPPPSPLTFDSEMTSQRSRLLLPLPGMAEAIVLTQCVSIKTQSLETSHWVKFTAMMARKTCLCEHSGEVPNCLCQRVSLTTSTTATTRNKKERMDAESARQKKDLRIRRNLSLSPFRHVTDRLTLLFFSLSLSPSFSVVWRIWRGRKKKKQKLPTPTFWDIREMNGEEEEALLHSFCRKRKDDRAEKIKQSLFFYLFNCKKKRGGKGG